MTWSDHCPLHLRVRTPLFRPHQSSWHLNESILSDTLMMETARKTLQDYIADNEMGDTTPLMCWDAHKAVIRRYYIAVCSKRKKELMQAILDLS
ncbi:translocase of inner mitochondrial membrane 8 homolog A (yeast), isoform CRA_a [Pelobates cultripes]|uniref:Translocase of inner mitochondrial membrane 8 homolog A (Yeast), isoform CRA_a n=1 Tax=Pelobates cultripes TaxID=61616 RepID=A0AAD1W7X3_PELCU|nr:translocase of inner mitochondrial membrane 8 homolog A (yeast), isoform CRA_a [Pelobates cultripes]